MAYFSSLQYFLYALFPLMTIALVGSISCGEKEELDKISVAQSPYVLPSQDPSYASDRIPEMFL